MDFIVFSDDWGEHPSSCQHLFREIARDHRVLWVNTVGMRAPRMTVTDLRKAFHKTWRMIAGAGESTHAPGREPPPNLAVLQPPMVPLPGLRLARAFNDSSARRSIAAAMKRHGLRTPIVVTTVPNACDLVDRLGASMIVYYCVDDFAQWPGTNHRVVRAMEKRLIDRADLLLATSDKLQEALGASGKTTHLFEHGVDLETFGSAEAREHPTLAGLPRPRAGFFGLLDERLDQDLLAELASGMSDWTFVLAGPQATSLPSIESHLNVVRLGPLPYQELPRFIAGIDVLILPYRVNEFTDTISPLKLNEYLATRRPIVSTGLREAKKRVPLVRIAADPSEWRDALNDALALNWDDCQADSQRTLAELSWRNRASIFLELVARRD